MNSNGLTKENLLFTFPVGLRENQSIAALGDVTAEELAKRPAEIGLLSIYARIDELPEDLLDILAYDFKVDWWDPNYSLEEKRRTFKDSWYVHKHLGTKAAVEMAIRAIYPLTTVEEWFEYGGEPYHFRLNIDITSDSGDRVRQRRVLERLNYYKSLRSHNDGVRYFLYPEKSWAVAGGGFVGSRTTDRANIPVPPLKKPGGEFITVAGGGLVGSIERVKVKLNANRVKVPTGRAATGGAAGMFHSYQRVRVSIPAITISGR